MKRLLLILIILLLIPLSVQAATDEILGVSTYDEILGIGTSDEFLGVAVASASPCPSYYASAILSWDGDHSSGVLNACNSTGSAVLFTSSGADISTYGDGGSNAMKVDDSGEEIVFNSTENQYANTSADQTVCMRIKLVTSGGSLDNEVRIYETEDSIVSPNDRTYLRIQTDDDVVADWTANGSWLGAAGGNDAVPVDTWVTIGGSWEGTNTTNGDISANDSDATWDGDWQADPEITGAMEDGVTYIRFGSISGDPGDTEYILIDEWAIFSGKEVDCSTYMGN